MSVDIPFVGRLMTAKLQAAPVASLQGQDGHAHGGQDDADKDASSLLVCPKGASNRAGRLEGFSLWATGMGPYLLCRALKYGPLFLYLCYNGFPTDLC